MAGTKVIGARVPRALYEGARNALGLPESTSDSELIRRALAELAGLDIRDFPLRPGRPRQVREDATT